MSHASLQNLNAFGDQALAHSPYVGKICVIATMHGKEAAIAPVLRRRLGMNPTTTSTLDTDSLGTFSGEIPRAGSMDDAAVQKARLGMLEANVSLGVASEGSFGPHPATPFVAAGRELMVLVDDERGIVIRDQLLDQNPMFDHIVASTHALESFLRRMDFPKHAAIVRPSVAGEPAARAEAIAQSVRLSLDGCALVQTDMRPHMNPTRMATLGTLAERFAARIASLCPGCGSPGFGLVGQETGLPCAWCGGPSVLVVHRIFGCVACDYREVRGRDDGLTQADPGRCPDCNP